jgi:hypothetical protein
VRGFKYPDLVSVAAERSFLPIRCFRNAAGTTRGPGWEAAERGLHDVVRCQSCRFRCSRHRSFPARAVGASRLAPGPAASTYYSQAKAKYAKCQDFTESVPASLMLKFVNRVKKLR